MGARSIGPRDWRAQFSRLRRSAGNSAGRAAPGVRIVVTWFGSRCSPPLQGRGATAATTTPWGPRRQVMQYPAELKETVVRRALAREMTQEAIAATYGVSVSAVQLWVRQARQRGETAMAHGEKRARDWSAEERFNALLETHAMSEEELGAWCRGHGVHRHELAQWRRDAMAGTTATSSTAEERGQSKRLRKRIRRCARNSTAKTRRWRKRRRYWYSKKKSTACGRRTRSDEHPRTTCEAPRVTRGGRGERRSVGSCLRCRRHRCAHRTTLAPRRLAGPTHLREAPLGRPTRCLGPNASAPWR